MFNRPGGMNTMQVGGVNQGQVMTKNGRQSPRADLGRRLEPERFVQSAGSTLRLELPALGLDEGQVSRHLISRGKRRNAGLHR